MMKQHIVYVLRRTGLLPVADGLRCWAIASRNFLRNKRFACSLPGEQFPPCRISYDAYGRVDYEEYYVNGRKSAEVVLQLIGSLREVRDLRILEWGCGPGRIVRHLAALTKGRNVEVFGTDYNPVSISWCLSAIPAVQFRVNELAPPLPFESDFFDVVYSSSVFTHLSEAQHYAWLEEQTRVVRPGGLIIFTTQGDRFKDRMLKEEVTRYEKGEIVIRDKVKEGSRGFSAFQSPKFVREVFVACVPCLEIVRHETELPLALIQDIWVVRKCVSAVIGSVAGAAGRDATADAAWHADPLLR